MCPALEMQRKEIVMKCLLSSGWETEKVAHRKTLEKKPAGFIKTQLIMITQV